MRQFDPREKRRETTKCCSRGCVTSVIHDEAGKAEIGETGHDIGNSVPVIEDRYQ